MYIVHIQFQHIEKIVGVEWREQWLIKTQKYECKNKRLRFFRFFPVNNCRKINFTFNVIPTKIVCLSFNIYEEIDSYTKFSSRVNFAWKTFWFCAICNVNAIASTIQNKFIIFPTCFLFFAEWIEFFRFDCLERYTLNESILHVKSTLCAVHLQWSAQYLVSNWSQQTSVQKTILVFPAYISLKMEKEQWITPEKRKTQLML